MSDTVKSVGYIAELKNHLSEERNEEVSEWLYDNEAGLRLNYEGTLIYSQTREDIYGLEFDSSNPLNEEKIKFIEKCLKADLEIEVETIRRYSCIWYTGVDSDMSMLSLNSFKGR